MNAFGEHLCSVRRRAFLTQKQLADRIGVEYGIYGMFESGKLVPSERLREAICDQCAVPPEERRALKQESDA